MLGDTLSFRERLIFSKMDESADICGHAQLIANIKYIDGDSITNNFFCKGRLSEQLAMRYFVSLTNIYAKMDSTGRTVLVCALMGRPR
jgi:hypothetical protein